MHVLILGATGMLGHMACRVFAQRHEVYAAYRAPGLHPLHDGLSGRVHWLPGLDATDLERVGNIIREISPNWVINGVGLIKQKDPGDRDTEAITLNALLPPRLAECCGASGSRLLHFSTDCVFSGARGGYSEADEPDPKDLYGRTKLRGEVGAPHLTVRTSLIGRQLRGSEGLLEWFLAQRGRTIRGYANAIFTGLTTRALCTLLEHALRRRPDLAGLYHIASDPISKCDLLSRLNARLGLGIRIERDESFRCDRSLVGTRFARDTELLIPSWDEMLDQLTSEVEAYEQWRDGR